MKPRVRSAALSGYVPLTRSLGIAPHPLLREVGLRPAELSVQDHWIPGPAVTRLLERSAAAARREDFGLLLAGRRRFANLGPISLVAREEPTLRGALELLIRHEDAYNEMLHGRLDESGDRSVLKVWLESGEPAPTRQATELAVAVFHHVVREILGERCRPVAVCFTHSAPAELGTHRRLFGPAVEFDRDFDGLVLHTHDLDAPNPHSDPLLHAYARQFFDSVTEPRGAALVDQVRELIEALLPTGRCSIEEVAHRLGVDRRTVHRHLAAAGQTFSSLLNSTRARRAEQLVANPSHQLTEVSLLLGFSAPSGFSRWFRDQFGCTPRAWRARRTGTGASTPVPK
ncbi:MULTISPECIES: AraC family transcriptional regulator [unclassified Streptomyces]|uniref:AraC family transcriptional regulator n=1 Tax=unclassified Streptomyces TaxID=2593676 RepID=UPI00278BDCC3|nr:MULTISPECIES: AraC family transcriptional regulator [unclassified Streptomyces]